MAGYFLLPYSSMILPLTFYSIATIFYFGYLFFQFPAGYFLQRLPIGKFLSLTTIAWGIILICTPACTSFAGIATNRFLLGSVEATVNPGFVLLMCKRTIHYLPSTAFHRLESVIEWSDVFEIKYCQMSMTPPSPSGSPRTTTFLKLRA